MRGERVRVPTTDESKELVVSEREDGTVSVRERTREDPEEPTADGPARVR